MFQRVSATLAVCVSLALVACGGGPPADTGDGGGGGGGGSTGLVFVVGDTAALPTDATRVAQLTDVPWASLPAGSTVIVSPGTYDGPVTLNAQGTAAGPITVRADDITRPPMLRNSVDFQQAAWVRVSHLVVQAPTFAGFVIRRGSHHITVADSVVRQAPMGVDITDGAGTGHAILRNRIEDSATNGIGVDGVNASATDRTLIQSNTVLRSGHHGMEVRGSNYQIEHNTVSQSGQAIAGTSGIHLYSRSAADDACDGNLVRYNHSHSNADTQASDGNGIQVDQWCDANTVAFNVVWDNDGAGIIVFDGNDNQVFANTARGNGRNPGGSHGALGELIVNGEGQPGRPAANRVYDNLLVATRPGVPAMLVDSRAVAQGNNAVGPNLLYSTTGGTVLRWTDSQTLHSAAQIDAATGSHGNLVQAPAFANAAQPLANGLRLVAHPGANGVVLSGQTDLLGQSAQEGWAFFGAYFTAP